MVLLACAGCAFEKPRAIEPDAGNDAGTVDATIDAPGTGGTAICEDSVEIEGSHYRLLPTMNRAAAVAACAAIPGTHLVTFESLKEITDVVAALSLTGDVWTGIKQVAPSGTLQVDAYWFNYIGDGRTAIPVPFPWEVNEPNDYDAGEVVVESGEEDFAMMSPDGLFSDVLPNRQLRPLCECKRRL